MNTPNTAGGQQPPTMPPLPPQRPVQGSAFGGRSGALFRSILTMSASGLALAFCIIVIQALAPDPFKPATLYGEAVGAVEAATARIQAEDRAREAELIAEAQAEGQRKAEIEYQVLLKALETEYNSNIQRINTGNQIALGAYNTLYQRSNAIVQGAIGLESQMLAIQAEAVSKTHVGKNMIANVTDFMCAFDTAYCDYGDTIRDQVRENTTKAVTTGTGQILKQYMAQLQTPAELQASLFQHYQQ